MPNPVVHFEFATTDRLELGAFYAELFGWALHDEAEMHYTLAGTRNGDHGIDGGIGMAPEGEADAKAVRIYVEVDDLQAYLDKAEKLGATTIMGPVDIPGGPSLAIFQDIHGFQTGLVKNS